MQIAAVVVSHSRPDLLPQVIQALLTQTRPLDRIIIIDNASDVPVSALFGRDERLQVIRSDINVGGAGGFALGLVNARAAAADLIWLLDDDAVPRRDALHALENALTHVPPGTGAVCGTVMEDGAIATMHRRRFVPLLGLEHRVGRGEYQLHHTPVDIASFVGFLVLTKAVARVGTPDTNFFLSYDDTEYSLRLRANGMGISLVPGSVVDHFRCSQARLRSTAFGRRHYFNIRNRIVVKRRYAQASFLGVLSGVLFGLVLWVLCRGRFRRHTLRILIRAVSDGYRGRLGVYPPDLDTE